MKKIRLTAIAAFFALAFSSCAVTTPYQESRYILDFRPYLEDGFKIYSTPLINEPYECLANITLEVMPGTKKEIISGKSIVGEDFSQKVNVNVKVSPDALLKKFVIYAKDLGANGILDMQMKSYYEDSHKVYILSGSAIKINT
jgi:hypothetical protein